MTKKSVFLDTSFLVASQVKGHEFLERTIELRKQFIYEKANLITSQIVFDDFWYVLIGLSKASVTNIDPKKLYSQLKKATQNVLLFEALSLLDLDLTAKELVDTLDIMYRFKQRPRDAIIVKIMKKAKVKYIASFDEHFDKVSGISRIY
ncbi:hypothetical protein A2716_00840 [candidate division WWE3 bacterium RIFCSPHIGHO2_01_FULL_40_23]|uniref:PIN domain-containing protein n=1 Tax=candidate division WWE3 bacterium RIFCSPLOWO2_01_FULL_41_18 TaxID=1802625 RepID=A0A1F4VEC4_UNCKA|nr:MAG: hypothetical protein A2716_00840 [candidate division WWE3 bacterium RIFCSPHIGHO2_01_FULL_40_23]OGC55537.1 MAG: hypothetical protein A3A78_01110 [candidate division WWE3 bacterium RIFCSPLOWO2_01_FULL_41_18]